MSDKGNGNGQAGSSRRIYFIICFFLIIIVALVGVIAFLLGRNTGGSENGTQSSNNVVDTSREVVGASRVILDEDSAADVMEEMRKEVEEGMFECQMSMTWDFDNGSATSRNAYVANSNNNKYPIYFDVILNDTGENIYSSPVLPVGAELKNFSLGKNLEPGKYKATVMYSLIRDENSQEVISSAGFVITINING